MMNDYTRGIVRVESGGLLDLPLTHPARRQSNLSYGANQREATWAEDFTPVAFSTIRTGGEPAVRKYRDTVAYWNELARYCLDLARCYSDELTKHEVGDAFGRGRMVPAPEDGHEASDG
jgi:hypothetical protein